MYDQVIAVKHSYVLPSVKKKARHKWRGDTKFLKSRQAFSDKSIIIHIIEETT